MHKHAHKIAVVGIELRSNMRWTSFFTHRIALVLILGEHSSLAFTPYFVQDHRSITIRTNKKIKLSQNNDGFTSIPENNHLSTNGILTSAKTSLKSKVENRRKFLSSILVSSAITISPIITNAGSNSLSDNTETEGLIVDIITQSDFGVAARRATVRGAQLADRLDEKWERFSDSLRDKSKCDANTNRRLFDNGFRKDGTRVGNPVLGGLCNPVPLKELDEDLAQRVLLSAERVVLKMKNGGTGCENMDTCKTTLHTAINDVENLVAPAFERAAGTNINKGNNPEQAKKRFLFNKQLYVQMRASSGFLFQNNDIGTKMQRDLSNEFELEWGKKLLTSNINPTSQEGGILSPTALTRANRQSFFSPFPALSPEDKIDLNYDEDSLLDALGAISVALQTLQDGGLIGNWEISIPVDDFGEVVTIAVDDDISLGAQVLLREQQQKRYSGTTYFTGSAVIGIARASLLNVGIICGLDSFFLDPSTTKQDVYNPTQLLINLSNIRSI